MLERLLQKRLFAKAEKCEFHSDTISFLGYIIAPRKITMNPVKVATAKEWPQPETRKQLHCFLGFANFNRRYIKNYSRIAAPLTALTFTTRVFSWSPEASAAFLEHKRRFTEAPILIQPDPKLYLYLLWKWMHLMWE